MKMEIKSWLTGNVLYSADAENIKELLMSAIKSGVNLSHAGLYGVNLSHADLYGANLFHANLSGAVLSYANLSHANLSGAVLSYAVLSDANLSHAVLSHANLDKKYSFLSISPIGSENGCLWTFRGEDGVLKLNRGCFSGTLPEFVEAVKEKHSGNKYERQYMAAIELIKTVLGVDEVDDTGTKKI
jgi:hypothetical protein